jgi:hypothetical protein
MAKVIYPYAPQLMSSENFSGALFEDEARSRLWGKLAEPWHYAGTSR